ncbi:hypothetical protein PJP14_29465, partial [Mycobacterium kansasii]
LTNLTGCQSIMETVPDPHFRNIKKWKTLWMSDNSKGKVSLKATMLTHPVILKGLINLRARMQTSRDDTNDQKNSSAISELCASSI